MRKVIDWYARLVARNAGIVLGLCVLVSVFAVVGMGMMETKSMDYQDMLPENYDVIKAFDLISEDFGGTTSGLIVIEIDDEFVSSNEVRKVVEPEVVAYSLLIEEYFVYLDGVESVSGVGAMVRDEFGHVPGSVNEIREVTGGIGAANFVSEKEDMMLISLSLDEDVDGEVLTEEILELLDELDKPEGIRVFVSGEIFEDVIVNEETGPDTSKTSMISMVVIVVILFLLFRSFKGVLVPLMTIICGIIWTMGFLGWTGGGLSSMTSGAVTMIMGIGIDFGIQVMSRFNRELEKAERRVAMERTLQGILGPILTTALACLIGFKAMGLGELSMMGELGEIMSLGVVFCMAAAVTLVPSLLVVVSRGKK